MKQAIFIYNPASGGQAIPFRLDEIFLVIKDCSHMDLAALFFRIMNNELIEDTNVLALRSAKFN